MERYGIYSEKTYRNQFEKGFDFIGFNDKLIAEYTLSEKVIAFDPSFLSKSGKKTSGLGYFYSGIAQQYKKGIEIGCLAVVDVTQNTAYHFHAQQSPSKAVRKRDMNQETLMDVYSQQIIDNKEALQRHSKILTADGYFAKKKFIDTCCEAGFEVISRLRSDANLCYIFKGPQRKGKVVLICMVQRRIVIDLGDPLLGRTRVCKSKQTYYDI